MGINQPRTTLKNIIINNLCNYIDDKSLLSDISHDNRSKLLNELDNCVYEDLFNIFSESTLIEYKLDEKWCNIGVSSSGGYLIADNNEETKPFEELKIKLPKPLVINTRWVLRSKNDNICILKLEYIKSRSILNL